MGGAHPITLAYTNANQPDKNMKTKMKLTQIPAGTYAPTTSSPITIEAAMAYLIKRGKPIIGEPLPVIGRNVLLWHPSDAADLPPLTVSRL